MNHVIFWLFLALFTTQFANLQFEECIKTLSDISEGRISFNNVSNSYADIETHEFSLKIVCKTFTNFDITLLPNVNFANNINTLEMQNCPMPNITLTSIKKKMNMDFVVYFKLTGCTDEECELSKNIFDGKLNDLEDIKSKLCKTTSVKNIESEFTQNLKYLTLRENRLKFLPEKAFFNLEDLLILDLSENLLSSLNDDLFHPLCKLEMLFLSNNNIKGIPIQLFLTLNSLKYLYMERNELEILEQGGFRNLTSLQVLSLDHNKISVIQQGAFSGLNKLEDLNLQANNVTFIQMENEGYISSDITTANRNVGITKVPSLWEYPKFVNVGNISSDCTYCSNETIITRTLTIDMSENIVSFIIRNENMTQTLPSYSVEVHLDRNVLCRCINYDWLAEITKYKNTADTTMYHRFFKFTYNDVICRNLKPMKSVLKGLQLIDVPCPFSVIIGCPQGCLCSLRIHDNTVVVDCSYTQLTSFPKLEIKRRDVLERILFLNKTATFSETEVNMEGNYLTNGPSKVLGYEDVTRLFLSKNELVSLDWIPPKIKVLTLDNNQLETLDNRIIKILENAENVTLFDNPWKCDCSAKKFQEFLQKKDLNDVICSETQLPLISVTNLCPSPSQSPQPMDSIIPTSIIICLLLVLLAIVTFYYRYKNEIKIYLYSKNVCLQFVTEEDMDKHKLYDIFICYSHKDEHFVVKELLPRLESGLNPFKVCIHVRDWVVGEFIPTQILESVRNSKRTLVVLSKNFIKSEWARMEFRTAHAQTLTEGRPRLIVVIYGDLDENGLDNEFKMYFKTNTYVKWGDAWFWKKLTYALPHPNRTTPKEVDADWDQHSDGLSVRSLELELHK